MGRRNPNSPPAQSPKPLSVSFLEAPQFSNAMSESQQNLNALIKSEADVILYEKGLFDILSSFGTPYVHGSYLLDLMTWRDLDIYLQVDGISSTDFFVLGERICSSFAPVKMSFRNELIAKTKGLPAGLYWGVYLGNERAGAWKIDIWAVTALECERLLQYCATIKEKLNPDAVQRILEIKSECWQDAEYRRSYSSSDIYKAVLDNDVTSMEGFKEHMRMLNLTE
jgi:hypothetical protein